MLNIIQRKTETLRLRVYLSAVSGFIIKVPQSFKERSFAIKWQDDIVTLTEHQNGKTVSLWNEELNSYQIRFGKTLLPFEPFDGIPHDIEASYDGKTIIFKTPVFAPRQKKISAPKVKKEDFADLRQAIQNVNSMASKYSCELEIKHGAVTGTIRI